MVRSLMYVTALVCFGILFGGGSCQQEEQALVNQAGTVVTNTINNNPSTVTAGFYSGLQAVAKLNATDANLTATALTAACQNAVASFSGASLPLGADAQVILNNLGKNLPANASGIVTMITGATQTFITIPSASSKVPPATATLVINLCNEIIAACAMYQGTLNPVAPASK